MDKRTFLKNVFTLGLGASIIPKSLANHLQHMKTLSAKEAAQYDDFLKTIRNKYLQVTIEETNLSGEPFRALVKYRNINKVHWRFFKTSMKELNKARRKYSTSELLGYFLKKKCFHEKRKFSAYDI